MSLASVSRSKLPRHPLVPVSPHAVLSVRVVRRGEDLVPRIAYVYPVQPQEAHEAYAVEHGLASLVWARSKGRGWDVRTAHGHDERGLFYAGAELALDQHTYECARVGEDVLSELARALEGA